MIKNLQNNNNNNNNNNDNNNNTFLGGWGCKNSGLQMFTKTAPKFSRYST